MTDAASAKNTPLVSRERCGNAIRDALRLYVGRGRRYSVKQLSNATGVKGRVIECAMCDAESVDWRPLPNEALVSISKFLGPEFTCEWLGLADQEACWKEPEDGDIAALNTDAAEYNYEHSKATDPSGPGGAEVLPIERQRLKQIARRIAPRARTVAA